MESLNARHYLGYGNDGRNSSYIPASQWDLARTISCTAHDTLSSDSVNLRKRGVMGSTC